MSGPHFTAIEIQSFRGLANVRLGDLSRVNLIVGRNNAGKTTVLEAITACCHPVNADAWLGVVRRRGLGAPRQTMQEQFTWLFPRITGGSMASDIHLYYERLGVPKRWHIYGHLTMRREVADDPDSEDLVSATQQVAVVGLYLEPVGAPADSPSRVRCEFEIRPRATIPEERSSEDAPTISVTPISHRAEMFQIKAMTALDSAEKRASLVALLQKLDPDVENIEVYDPSGTRSSIRIWHRRMGAAPLNAFGDGFRRTLTYALSLVQCRGGGVLTIDEIETAIHYSALRDVYRWLVEGAEELDVQLFVTTHSLEAVDALLEATPASKDTSFYRLDSAGGAVRVVRFDEEELRALRSEFGDEVRG